MSWFYWYKYYTIPIFKNQYILIYNALMEAVTLGETTIPCYTFNDILNTMYKSDKQTGKSKLQDQFMVGSSY